MIMDVKIKMLTNIGGPNFNASAGAVLSISETAAAEMVRGGYAEYVDAPKAVPKKAQPETATVKPPEDTSLFGKGKNQVRKGKR